MVIPDFCFMSRGLRLLLDTTPLLMMMMGHTFIGNTRDPLRHHHLTRPVTEEASHACHISRPVSAVTHLTVDLPLSHHFPTMRAASPSSSAGSNSDNSDAERMEHSLLLFKLMMIKFHGTVHEVHHASELN